MYRTQEHWSAIVLSLILSAGALFAWIFFQALVTLNLIMSLSPNEQRTLFVSKTGDLFVKSTSSRSSGNRFFEVKNGQLTETHTSPTDGLPLTYLAFPKQLKFQFEHDRIGHVLSNRSMNETWFTIISEDTRLFIEGFSTLTNERIGYIGRRGFTLNKPSNDEMIPMLREYGTSSVAQLYVNGQESRLAVLTPDGPVLIDVLKRSIEHLTLSFFPKSVGTWSTSWSIAKNDNTFSSGFAFRGEESVCLTSSDGSVVESFPIPQELRDQYIELYLVMSDSPYLLVSHDGATGLTETFQLDSEGKVVRQENLTLETATGSGRSNTAWQMAILFPVLSIAAFIDLYSLPSTEVTQGIQPSLRAAQAIWLSASWPSLLLISILSLGLAIWTYRRHQKFDHKSAVIWSVFVFLLGPAGLVGYLAHRTWPAREKCHSCGDLTRVDQMACTKCGEEFPLPERNGSEILVPA
ncbi:hypothetical protein K2Y11_16300 [bacterium]|nr:hypothetical protein [bacterium]